MTWLPSAKADDDDDDEEVDDAATSAREHRGDGRERGEVALDLAERSVDADEERERHAFEVDVAASGRRGGLDDHAGCLCRARIRPVLRDSGR